MTRLDGCRDGFGGTVAALYVDTRNGPYPSIPGVDCWGLDRDATRYQGPHPVVAHPPCGHWGRYHQRAHDDGSTGPIAVEQVRRWGGVLEHPRDSKLWFHCGLPLPGWFPDQWGGRTFEIRQIDFGHRAEKPTWLYVVGATRIPPLPPRMPKPDPPPPLRTGKQVRGWCEMLSKVQRRVTPKPLAEWLVALARACRRGGCDGVHDGFGGHAQPVGQHPQDRPGGLPDRSGAQPVEGAGGHVEQHADLLPGLAGELRPAQGLQGGLASHGSQGSACPDRFLAPGLDLSGQVADTPLRQQAGPPGVEDGTDDAEEPGKAEPPMPSVSAEPFIWKGIYVLFDYERFVHEDVIDYVATVYPQRVAVCDAPTFRATFHEEPSDARAKELVAEFADGIEAEIEDWLADGGEAELRYGEEP